MNTYQDTYKHKGLRQNLIELLKSKGISDPQVLNAILTLPRHFFLPHEFENHAYEDKAFPIGEDQTISQPYTVAYQTQLLQLKPKDKVLEIGTGSGYQGSVLALCGAEVYSIERHAILSENAGNTLKRLKAFGIDIQMQRFVGDGTKGLAAHGPYHKMVVTAGRLPCQRHLSNNCMLVVFWSFQSAAKKTYNAW